jgi:hypothetical protein
MYDCFTYTVMATMEDFGSATSKSASTSPVAGRRGDVGVNPHGGLLSEDTALDQSTL